MRQRPRDGVRKAGTNKTVEVEQDAGAAEAPQRIGENFWFDAMMVGMGERVGDKVGGVDDSRAEIGESFGAIGVEGDIAAALGPQGLDAVAQFPLGGG